MTFDHKFALIAKCECSIIIVKIRVFLAIVFEGVKVN
jgi:hypothetical protein